MREIVSFKHPTRVIAHFQEDEEMCAKSGKRLPLYQLEISADPKSYSPSGDFVRFNFTTVDGEPVSEIHGWVRVDSIVIDEVIEECISDEWVVPRKVANG